MHRFVSACLLAALLSVSAYAGIINIPDDFETIQAGIDAAEHEDTVLVQPGEYVENIRFPYPLISITLASLHLTTRDPEFIETTIIDGGGEDAVLYYNDNQGPSRDNAHLRLDGLTIQNGHGSGLFCHNENRTTIRHCVFKDNVGMGHRTAIFFEHGLNLIENCQFYNNRGNNGGAITCYAQSEMRGGLTTIRNSIIMNNSAEFGGGLCAEIANVNLINCTIVNNNSAQGGGGGVYSRRNSNIRIINSIFRNNEPQNVFFDPEDDPNTLAVSFSDIEGGAESVEANDNGEVEWLEGNIDADPLFVDPDEDDYRITDDSPCIDAGDPESHWDPDGTRSDMGAFYFHQDHPDAVLNVPEEFRAIQAAIDGAEDGDTVLVHPGLYRERIDFSGKEIVVGSLFLVEPEPNFIAETIIDGEWRGTVVAITGEEVANAQLAGFTIRNGEAETNGGGLRCVGASPLIHNCAVIQNQAGENGGGISCEQGASPVISNCDVHNNEARENGGGVFVGEDCDPVVTECMIAENIVHRTGGGVAVAGAGSPRFERCRIERNYASGNGVGISCLENAAPLFRNCTISRNWTDVEHNTWVVYSEASHAKFINCILYFNFSEGFFFAVENLEEPMDPSSVLIACSDIENGRNSIVDSDNGVVNWLEGNIEENPRFINEEENNYFLTAQSPCIDAGTAFLVFEGDTLIDLWEHEYDGNAPDMGAFESEFMDISPKSANAPSVCALSGVYPNPFNSAATITYTLPEQTFVSLSIYNTRGQLVEALVDRVMPAGRHSVVWDAGDISTGKYIIKLKSNSEAKYLKTLHLR